jgi:nucleoside-diphosphate-sugar epimerase
MVGGPGDVSDRSGWWPWVMARAASAGHTVLVPEGEGLATQIIDVRDLAQWIVQAAAERVSGAVNAVGERRPLAVVLALAAEVAAAANGQQARLRRMPDAWLLNQGVRPWAGPRSLPLWVPGDGHAGFGRWARTRALQTGLRCRPLADTLADVLAWEQRRPADTLRRVGLSDTDAAELLALADSAP